VRSSERLLGSCLFGLHHRPPEGLQKDELDEGYDLVKADRPSRTAQYVTLGRALADAGLSHVADFHDPTARVFLTDRGKHRLRKAELAARNRKGSMTANAVGVMADMMALRTSVIDAAVSDAISAGAKQLVILGAGYDGRAWRIPELAGVKVFEVDHPATQRGKRAHLSELPPPKGIVSFVPVNFETESLDSALQQAGHDRSSPTCWIWEGVVMYLRQDAMRATLASIAKRSAHGSTLIVNYHTIHRGFFSRLIFRLIGEPQISAWTPEEMAADLRSVGFTVREDSAVTDWNIRFAQGKAKVERGFYMRVAVARR
jgi:methyltransferase (TIGR00027 family)